MNRIIKFRGKRLKNGEWICGDLLHVAASCYITNHSKTKVNDDHKIDCYEVDPDTVGQFTGMFDRNGKEVYEGDIVMSSVTYTDEDEYTIDFWRVGEIRYSANGFCLTNCTNYDNQEMTEKSDMQPSKKSKHNFPAYRSRVVGNIHDSIRSPKRK